MKAAIFEKPGIENLQVKRYVEEPKITDHDVLVRVRMCGVNPIDHMQLLQQYKEYTESLLSHTQT